MKRNLFLFVIWTAIGIAMSVAIAYAGDNDPLPGAPVCGGQSEDPLMNPQCGTDNGTCAELDLCEGSGSYGDKVSYCCKDSEDAAHHTGCKGMQGKWKCCDSTNSWKKVCLVFFEWHAGSTCDTVDHMCH